MIVKSFISLSEEERRELFEFINEMAYVPSFNNIGTMVKDFSGEEFKYGKEYFTIWENDKIKATMGLISIEADVKGEVFITSIYAEEKSMNCLFRGFDFIKDIINKTNAKIIKIGISKGREHLIPFIEELGFIKVYDIVILKFEDMKAFSRIDCKSNIDSEYKNLSYENTGIFRKIHNKAFISSPNGGMMSEDEAKEIANSNKNTDWAGIYYLDKKPVGMYHMDVSENTVWIEAIGVLPEYQGKGIGKLILKHAVLVALRENYDNIKLNVVTANKIAYSTYLKYGFEFNGHRASWFSMKFNKI